MNTAARFLLIILAVTLTVGITAGNAVAEKKKKSAKTKQTPAAKNVDKEGELSEAQKAAEGEETEPEKKLRRIPLDMVFAPGEEVVFREPNAGVGLNIFLKKCSACHSVIGEKKTGKSKKKKKIAPSLLNVTKRHSEEWLVRWLADPQVVWEDEEDEETNELKSRVLEKGVSRSDTKMKLRLLQKDIPHIIAYLKTVVEEEKKGKSKKHKRKKR